MGNRQLFDSKSPQQLLEEFKSTGDNAPFEEIVRRYAAMVFGVCLRVTGDKHDAEDATQAVFLSLALQAKTSREITYVGPWLQKVAHRLALDVKKSKTRRKRREERVADEARATNGNGRHFTNGGAFGGGNGHAMNPADAPGAEELKAIMMEELNQLPAKYRLPLVMHYFGGLSREEMSEQLGCNPSTLGVRVHRGKAMLGTRLAKRGIAISAIALAVVLEHVIREGAVAPIIGSATAAGSGLVAGSNVGVMLAASKVAMIVRSTARAVVYAKMKYAVVILMVITTTALASTTGALQQIKNHLPSLNIGQWIKPLFDGWTPKLRVDASEDPLDAVPTITTHDPQLKIDRDRAIAPQIAMNTASQVATPSTPAAHRAAPPLPTPEPKLNATARAILAPNFAPPAVLPSLKFDAPRISIDTQDAAAPDPTETPLATASTESAFNLGAGGGGGSGKPDVYVMPENATLRNSSMTIGDAGSAVFRQSGGVNKVNGALTLGKQAGSKGVYEQTGGMLLAQREVIGDAGEGSYILQKGINRVEQSIIVGNTGSGTVQQSGGQVIIESKPGTTDGSRGLVLANAVNSTAAWSMSGGSLDATPQYIGKGGTALFSQTGGTNTSGAIHIAADAGSVATYSNAGGQVVLSPVTAFDATGTDTPADNPPIITVGEKGDGTFQLGNVVATGTVRETGQYGASVIVRGEPTAAGAIRGNGKADLTGTLVNNGQIVADGFRHDRTLDLSSFTTVTSTIENPAWAGTNGWFARRRGELKLPAIHVAQGTGTYTWGEFAGDDLLDLVNSVRFKVENAKGEGDVSIALLSAIRTDIPTLPLGHHFIGVWSFDAESLGGYDSVDFDIRYDDAAAAAMDLDENILKLWRYDPIDSSWHRIMDDTFGRDVLNHIISGTAPGELTYFAVSAPEPTGATLLIIGATAYLARRSRRRPL